MSEMVDKCTGELLRAIRGSEAFHEYERCRELLGQHPDLWRKAQDFRRRSFLFQSSPETEDMLAEMNQLFKDRTELRKNKIIADYLSAELGICRMLQRVSLEILGAVELELDSFRDVLGI